ncbi:MAG: sigma-70 family RNA polymerase sigma factor [Planctomycetota bacterium]
MTKQPLKQEDFLRVLLKNEREILRYVLVIVPNLSDAQEVVQETAVALWKQIDRYDPALPFAPWACRFAANKAKEHLRKQGRWRGFLDEEVATMLLERRREIQPQLDRRLDPLRDCVSKLPLKSQDVLSRYYFEDRSVQEIAVGLGRTQDAIYKLLQRVRSTLMDCVNQTVHSQEPAS